VQDKIGAKKLRLIKKQLKQSQKTSESYMQQLKELADLGAYKAFNNKNTENESSGEVKRLSNLLRSVCETNYNHV